jgi:hypothetical protein
MKTKLFLILCILLSLHKMNLAQASFPSGSLLNSPGTFCTNPITMQYGVSASNFSVGDPVTFFIDFGDGTNYTAPIQYVANTPYDSLFGTVTHTYTMLELIIQP